MRRRLTARGPVPAPEAWDRYVRPARWPEWSPQIRRVDYDFRTLRTGTDGVVHGPLGLRLPFTVISVAPADRTWRWIVRLGPIRLRLAHRVTDGGTELFLDGPAVLVLAYLPLAQLALNRLVTQ